MQAYVVVNGFIVLLHGGSQCKMHFAKVWRRAPNCSSGAMNLIQISHQMYKLVLRI
jgi:hypothetical protein